MEIADPFRSDAREEGEGVSAGTGRFVLSAHGCAAAPGWAFGDVSQGAASPTATWAENRQRHRARAEVEVVRDMVTIYFHTRYKDRAKTAWRCGASMTFPCQSRGKCICKRGVVHCPPFA